MVISHTQERLTADHKEMPSDGSTSRNGLEQNKLVAIPLVNKRVDVVFTSRAMVGKGEECVTIDVKESDPPSLQRVLLLMFSSGQPRHFVPYLGIRILFCRARKSM